MTHTPKNAVLSQSLRQNMERFSNIRECYFNTLSGSDTQTIHTDWFGAILTNFSGGDDILIKNFEDLAGLDAEKSKAYLTRYLRTSSGGKVLLNHLLNFPPNIKALITVSKLSVFSKRAVVAALLAKEIYIRSTKPRDTANRVEIHKVPIDKEFLSKLALNELVAQRVITKDSPIYLRELACANRPDLTDLLGVDKGVGFSASPTLFRSVYENLLNLPLSLELVNQSSILKEFFVIDAHAQENNRLGVSLNPMQVFNKLPPLATFLDECKKVIALGESIPDVALVKDTNQLAEENPDHDDFPRKLYVSTNPLIGDLINKNYLASNYDQAITASFPEMLEFLAKLMRDNSLKFEACPRVADHFINPTEYREWLDRTSGRGRDSSHHIRVALRINPIVENVLILIAYGSTKPMLAFKGLWIEKFVSYLQTEENMDLVNDASNVLHSIYVLINSIHSWTGRMVDHSINSSNILDTDGVVETSLKSCKGNIDVDFDSNANPTESQLEYNKLYVGGFDFSKLQG